LHAQVEEGLLLQILLREGDRSESYAEYGSGLVLLHDGRRNRGRIRHLLVARPRPRLLRALREDLAVRDLAAVLRPLLRRARAERELEDAGEKASHPDFRLRAMNAFTVSRARSVCIPSFATHSCSLSGNRRYSIGPPPALYVATNFSCAGGRTFSSSAPCITRSGIRLTFSRRSRISCGLDSWIVSHGTKKVLLFLIMLSRLRLSAFWKRAKVLLIGDRVAT